MKMCKMERKKVYFFENWMNIVYFDLTLVFYVAKN